MRIYNKLMKVYILPTLKLIFVQAVLNIYTLFDGLAYNMCGCGYFASCVVFVVFFLAPAGIGKIRAMSKMSACIIC